MKSFSAVCSTSLLALFLLVLCLPAAAQAPAWQSARVVAAATTAAAGNSTLVSAMAVDAVGNVYLAGAFTNTVALGGTTLTSLGGSDAFVAKFDPLSNQFVWAQRAGGTDDDNAFALAVSGPNVYVAGQYASASAGFGATTLANASGAAVSADVFVAKLSDAGSTGSFAWAQRAGGVGYDRAAALAVSGTSVYVAGSFYGPTISFGASVLTNAGSSYDGFVAKLTDAGSTGSFVWAQPVGGTGSEMVSALAVSGTNVYVAGGFNTPALRIGPATLTNAGTNDAFVARLTDAGSTSSFAWAQRAGGSDYDAAYALAVNGASVYIAGIFGSLTADFGPVTLTNTSATSSFDMFVAKLSETGNTGSFVWAQRAGGSGNEAPNTLTVSGPNVYVAGQYASATAGFGATTLANASGAAVSADVFVAKLSDAGSTGSFAWAQQAGGSGGDNPTALAVRGTTVYVAGTFASDAASFGSLTLTSPNRNALGFLATLTDPTLTATTIGNAPGPVQLFPNPARHTATLRSPTGTAPAPLTLTDALGRTVRQYPAPAGSEATLDLDGLPAGLYLLRGVGPAQRLAVK
jgi:hypothetical protein